MAKKRLHSNPTYYVADTENTVNDKEKTEVWGVGICPVGAEEIAIFNNMDEYMEYVFSLTTEDNIIYYHNLGYDGTFILDWLLTKGYEENYSFNIQDGQFNTCISNIGQWYYIRVKQNGKMFEFRDSYKILPDKVERIAKNFKTKHQKLVGEIDYSLPRHSGWEMTEEEKAYLTNDILVMSEALEMIRPLGLLECLTIGAFCLSYYKNMMGDKFERLFPVLDDETDAMLRPSYKGGWCYVNPKFEDRVMDTPNGNVYDVNSLYPWAMHSTGNKDGEHWFPSGRPQHFEGDAFEEVQNKLYIVRCKVDMKVKNGYLPFIQIKHSRFKDNEYITDTKGMVELTLTRPDFELMVEHYNIMAIEIMEGWYFTPVKNIFDDYIDYWFKVKAENSGPGGNKVLRQIAKLLLNNLYGKFGTKVICGQHIPYYDGKLKFNSSVEMRDGIYIPVASYITSYARAKTIRAAQANYENFIYSDTDSIHLREQAVDIEVDDKELGKWANESSFTKGRWVRQKTYAEWTVIKDGQPCEPYMDLKACGCPESAKDEIKRDKSCDEILESFTFGLEVGGKLARKTVKGGAILTETTFKIR